MGEEGGGGELHHRLEDLGIGTWCLALTLGVFARSYLSKILPIPYTVVLLIFGLLIGLIYLKSHGSHDIFYESISKWVDISPEAVLYAILPILIFEASFSANLFLFYKQLPAVLVMAIPIVIISSVVIGFVGSRLLPHGWDFPTALLLGSILSPTDTVAPMAILRELGTPESLQLIVEGESLMNDGSALVLFSLSRSIVLSHHVPEPLDTFGYICRLSLGGPILGIVVGALASHMLGFMLNDPLAEITTTLIVGYGCYVLAESTGAHVSGVLAMVCAGLYMSFYGRGRISARVRTELNSFWAMLGYISNTLIFFISGLQMALRAMTSEYIHKADWGYMVIMYVLLNLLRLFGVFLFFPILRRGPYGIDVKQAIVLSYSGLRGAVGLTLAIAIHQDDNIDLQARDRILFYVAGVSLLTLIINGTTLSLLIGALQLNKESAAESDVYERTSLMIEQRLEERVLELKRQPYFGDANWAVVWRYIPVLTSTVYFRRIRKFHLDLTPYEVEVMSWHHEREHCDRDGQRQHRRLTKKKNLTGVPSRLRPTWRRYAIKFNEEVDCPQTGSEGLREIRGAALDAWRNHLVAEEQQQQRESTTKNKAPTPTASSLYTLEETKHHRRTSSGEQPPLPLSKGPSTVSLWEPGLEGIKRESTIASSTTSRKFTEDHGHCESLSLARQRVLTVLKHLYGANFHKGFLSNEGLQELEKNIYLLLTHSRKELCEWTSLEKQLALPIHLLQKAKQFRHTYLIGTLAESFMFSRLALFFELAVNFLQAHKVLEAGCGRILGTGSIVAKIQKEIQKEIQIAEDSINQFLPIFPNIFYSVKTGLASHILLFTYRSLLEETHDMGCLEGQHYHHAIAGSDDAINSLADHSYCEFAPSHSALLRSVGFLRFLTEEQIDSLFMGRSGKRFCADVYVRANKKLLKRGSDGSSIGGWYVVVRGGVQAGNQLLPPGATLGLIELILGGNVVEDHVTTTLTHLLVFDKAAMLAEAESNPALLKSIWWYLAVHELNKHGVYHNLEIGEVGEILADAEFHAVMEPKVKGGSLKIRRLVNIRQLEASDTDDGSGSRDRVITVCQPDRDILLIRSTASKVKKLERKSSNSSSSSGSSLMKLARAVTSPGQAESPERNQVIKAPHLLENYQGDLILNRGGVCFVIKRPSLREREAEGKAANGGAAAGEKEGKVTSSEVLPPDHLAILVEDDSGIDTSSIPAPLVNFVPPVSPRASTPSSSAVDDVSRSGIGQHGQHLSDYNAATAKTVTLADFFDDLNGKIDMKAVQQALASGEGLASFLTRQLSSSVADGPTREGSTKRKGKKAKKKKDETAAGGGGGSLEMFFRPPSGAHSKEGDNGEETKKKGKTALELMFETGEGGNGGDGNGGEEGKG